MFGYKKLYIGGELIDSSSKEKFDVICPGTEEKIAEIAWANKVDAEKALAKAAEGFKYWSKLTIEERTDWMLKLREEVIAREKDLREAIMYEMGKTYEAAEEDFETVVNALEWYPQEMQHRREEIIPDIQGTHHHLIVSEPAGVAIAFLAWNFPLLNFGFKVGPALAAGCSIIIKPSASSPLSGYIMGEICAGVGIPAGVINILTGPNSEVSDTLSSSPIPQVATMIGSSGTGRKLLATCSTSIKRASMELGGNAPMLVFPDGDLETATDIVNAIKFGGNSGQVCVAPDRIYVHTDIYKEFIKLLVEKASRAKLTFGRKNNPTMAPLVNSGACDRMKELVDDALAKGAKLEHGGKRPLDLTQGSFFEPTILTDCTPEMLCYHEEIFGPIAAIIPFEDEEDVLRVANDTEYGLASYLFTNDINRVSRISKTLEFGEVQVNGVKYSIYLPHGGIKESGMGHDCSHLALDDYFVKKRITIQAKG
jgi:succinate-semialdehyde dehydrogenase/glutarate-semialdehyde dehydrogenase